MLACTAQSGNGNALTTGVASQMAHWPSLSRGQSESSKPSRMRLVAQASQMR